MFTYVKCDTRKTSKKAHKVAKKIKNKTESRQGWDYSLIWVEELVTSEKTDKKNSL